MQLMFTLKRFSLFVLLPFLVLFYDSCQNDGNPVVTSIDASQQQLEIEKQNLERAKKYLDDLKMQLADQTQQLTQLIPSQIASAELQIQNLSDVLQNFRMAEQDIMEARASILQEQEFAVRIATAQIDPALFALQENIQQTQEQIISWTNTIYPLNIEQSTQLKNLQDLLSSQKQQLNSLTEQKLNISNEALFQTQLINSASQQQKIELVDSESNIQDQINFLREEIVRLEALQIQYKSSIENLNQLITKAQNNYEELLKKIKTLESVDVQILTPNVQVIKP